MIDHASPATDDPSPRSAATARAVARVERALATAALLAERERLSGACAPLATEQIRTQLRALVDKVMGEAGLYAPEAAARALKLAQGDDTEAVLLLRSFRASLPRRFSAEPVDTRGMFVLRRISSAFREIPGGQVLGPTRDYSQRLLETAYAHETPEELDRQIGALEATAAGRTPVDVPRFGKVTDLLRREGLLRPVDEDPDRSVQDVTREPLRFPAPRSAALQSLARAETGAIMALAYSGMRGQGGDHPTIGEVRVGWVRIRVCDPTGRRRCLGRILVTECENISKIKVRKKDPVPYLSIGYGLCFGQNETKAICMGMLDRSLRMPGDDAPAISQEFVLHHTDPADAAGAISALRRPHEVETVAERLDLDAALGRVDARGRDRAQRALRAPVPSPSETIGR